MVPSPGMLVGIEEDDGGGALRSMWLVHSRLPFFLFVPLVRTLSQGAHFFQMVKTFAIPSVGRPDKLTRELVRSAET